MDSLQVAQMGTKDSYFHPLYLVTEEDDTNFWAEKSWYYAIARVHFAKTVDVTETRKCIERRMKREAQKGSGSLQLRVYQTIELSDMVLALHANNMKEMLTFLLSLRQYSCIGKVYTYCGIDYDCIRGITDERKALPTRAEKDEIPCFSMRLSAADFQAAHEELKDVEKILGAAQPYSVTGVDDIAAQWTPLPMEKIIALYQAWFVPKAEEDGNLISGTSDVTTRVGISLDDVPTPESRGDKTQKKDLFDEENKDKRSLQNACLKLVKLDRQVQSIAGERLPEEERAGRHRWLKCLSQLTKTLARMSKTPVMDEFVYLMLPGAGAFLRNVSNQLKNEDKISDKNVKKYQVFVGQWMELMEHAMRSEGQLTHQPELRPMVYDVPITMLEYILAFLAQCAEILQTNDHAKPDIEFLLVPQLCERIAARELFVATGELPGLVVVSIPLHMLYDPKVVQYSLCHETSHFVGETFRGREGRTGYYARAVAALMSKTVFNSYDPGLINVITKELQNRLNSYCPKNIYDLEHEIRDWLGKLLNNREKYSNLICDTLLAGPGDAEEPLMVENNIGELKYRALRGFFPALRDLTNLFRETYADLCMMYMLDLESEVYIESLRDELRAGDPCCEWLATRAFLCLKASNKVVPDENTISGGEGMRTFYRELTALQQDWEADYESDKRVLPVSALIPLLQYLEERHGVLKETLDGSDKLGKLRKTYKWMANQATPYTDLEEFINQFRTQVMGKK